MKIKLELPYKLYFRYKIIIFWLKLWMPLCDQYYTWKYVGRRVKLSKKYVRDWVLSNANYESARGGQDDDFAEQEYDQEVLLALFTLMNEPVYGEIKGVGLDCVLVMLMHAGCQHWSYIEVKNLVLLD